MRHGRCTVAERTNDRQERQRRRRGFPLGILGALILIALVAAYLSDCLPGLGSGGELGTPSSDAPADPKASAEGKGAGEAAGDRIVIVVRGEQCRRGQAEPQSCPELCAALDRSHAATVEVAVEAVEGRHGTVEELRKCLQDAGFTRVRVHSE